MFLGMGVDRYSKDDEGFRKYVELIESTPVNKRKDLLESARGENPIFADAVEKHMLTFDRIIRLPPLEVTEVFSAVELKPEIIAVAICSVEDAELKERLIQSLPRKIAVAVHQEIKLDPAPEAFKVGGARLQVIQAARSLEKVGKLKSVQIPRFGAGYFRK